LIAVQYKQVLVVNWIRIKNIIVRVFIHKYVFCHPVCKADSMTHLMNDNICLGAATKGAGIVYVASNGKASRLNCIEITIAVHNTFRSNTYSYAISVWLAGLDELGIQTWATVPGCNSFLHFSDPIRCHVLGLKCNDDFGSPISFPWHLMITRILVL